MTPLEGAFVDDLARLRRAGGELAEAALRVVNTYDGTHRLALAISEWMQVIGNEGGRAGPGVKSPPTMGPAPDGSEKFCSRVPPCDEEHERRIQEGTKRLDHFVPHPGFFPSPRLMYDVFRSALPPNGEWPPWERLTEDEKNRWYLLQLYCTRHFGSSKRVGATPPPSPSPPEASPVRARVGVLWNSPGEFGGAASTQRITLSDLESTKLFRLGQRVRARPAGGEFRSGMFGVEWCRVEAVDAEGGTIVLSPAIQGLAINDDLVPD